ncbi:MAG: hypothetical protein DRP15_02715 [Candidatus Aenigmatarchaeota archaeon]|nr:MAG: hypothetical protein DRP15_02715 [Candidatus Aenigmarchaeota archaeon]
MEFEPASQMIQPAYQPYKEEKKKSRWVTVAIERTNRDKLRELGIKPNDAIKNFIIWEELRTEVLYAITEEIKKMREEIKRLSDDIERAIIGRG